MIGDFATTRAKGTFSLAYLVFHTINNPTTRRSRASRMPPRTSSPATTS